MFRKAVNIVKIGKKTALSALTTVFTNDIIIIITHRVFVLGGGGEILSWPPVLADRLASLVSRRDN
ncbi:MAG: hypothetical protein WDA68_03225 [Phycisphaerae bacterium]